jgi:cytochrome c-type biogenesis protein CcsB
MELRQLDTTSSIIALRYITALDDAAKTGKYGEAEDLLKDMKKFQRLAGEKVVPSETKVNLEVSYNKMGIFKNTYRSYLALGLVLLIIFFVRIFKKPSEKTDRIFKWLALLVSFLIVFMFVYHGVGLGLRWYISGHEPWSNGYEAVIFISWVTTLAGIIFSRKNPVILAGTAILASMMIFVTEMNLLDPEITPLQPVLKSYWLMIHVAVITSSYGFLGLAAILGLINLNLYIFKNPKNAKLIQINISELTYVSEMTMTIGLFMLTIGTFLGGIWANESWGRYWGWDPKETWALVSVLVYAVILHLRFIPALSGKFLFNAVSLWGYSAILFTFFGVNFYLVGLHSYAQGEGLGELPLWLKLTIVLFVLFTGTAVWRNYQFKKQQSALAE